MVVAQFYGQGRRQQTPEARKTVADHNQKAEHFDRASQSGIFGVRGGRKYVALRIRAGVTGHSCISTPGAYLMLV